MSPEKKRKTILKVDNINKAFGGVQALSSVGFELKKGDVFGVIGPNGSGKTTLLDLLTGFRQPSSGAVLLQGRPLKSWAKTEVARRLALVPQEYSVNFPFTVRELVAMGRHPHQARFGAPSEADQAATAAALTALDLEGMADKLIIELSGGEKQRVILARALAQESPTLLLDEPTANLDIYHALAALDLVAQKVKQGLTAVAVMHDLNLAASHCDYLIFLKNGRVAAQGATEEILEPGVVTQVFGVAARISPDSFTESLKISYRLPEKK